LLRLEYNEKKSFLCCGINDQDRVLLTCTLDRCFIAGLAYFLGVRSVGATALRNGLNSLESHVELLRELKPTAIVGVPSFLYRLGIYVQESSDYGVFDSVKKLMCIGEPIRNKKFILSELGLKLQAMWNAKLYSTYASSETITTFCECEEGRGGHLHPDLAIVEIVDDYGENLDAGEVGEVVVTPLGCAGMPLVRFKTGDISYLDESLCVCGRNALRLGPILGRKQQRLKIQGTTLYPQAIYSVLEGIPGISDYYLEVTEKETLSDEVKVFLSLSCDDLPKEKIEKILNAKLRVAVKVYIKSVPEKRSIVFSSESRKPQKFFDYRGKS
jgi:phenylacetate-CoA ligase